jgi:hypothetical protein
VAAEHQSWVAGHDGTDILIQLFSLVILIGHAHRTISLDILIQHVLIRHSHSTFNTLIQQFNLLIQPSHSTLFIQPCSFDILILIQPSKFSFNIPISHSHRIFSFFRWQLGTGPGMQDTMAETANVLRLGISPNLSSTNQLLAFNSSTNQLANGGRYYVTLTAVNGACPEGTAVFTSEPVLVDATPPVPVIFPQCSIHCATEHGVLLLGYVVWSC